MGHCSRAQDSLGHVWEESWQIPGKRLSFREKKLCVASLEESGAVPSNRARKFRLKRLQNVPGKKLGMMLKQKSFFTGENTSGMFPFGGVRGCYLRSDDPKSKERREQEMPGRRSGWR